jgi:1,2-diacylglycerol 3-beta-galactosyltransferase
VARVRRVVVVYSRVGGGHLSAARALAEELESTGRAAAKIVDAYLECARFPLTLFPAAYARLARDHPRLWSMVYHGSDTASVDSTRVLGPFLRQGFGRLLADERPDAVVSVLPAINGLLAQAAANNGIGLEVVLTDWYAVHHSWVARGVDHYTVPTDSARQDCVRFGAPAACVDVVGIPVRSAFQSPRADVDQKTVRARRLAELGLDPKRFTILAMVGAEGSPRALRNIARLAQADKHLDGQLLVMCGRNKKLLQHVQHLPSGMPVRAMGFANNVAELMRSADVLVTKAGGLTLAEAFACGVPVVVNDVLPGQEAGNLKYVLRQGAVEHAGSPAELVRSIAQLYHDPVKRAALAERGAQLARPTAGRSIAAGILLRLGCER